MGKDLTQTRLFNSEELKREVIHSRVLSPKAKTSHYPTIFLTEIIKM